MQQDNIEFKNHNIYFSFKYSPHFRIKLPSSRDVVKMLHHPHGILLLTLILIFNFSYVSMISSPPVLAVDPETNSQTVSNKSASLKLQYRSEIPPLISEYISLRGKFADKISNKSASQNDITTWLKIAEELKNTLLAYIVPGIYQDVHLGLVLAADGDIQAAKEYLKEPKEAEKLFLDAQDRFTAILMANSWLNQ